MNVSVIFWESTNKDKRKRRSAKDEFHKHHTVLPELFTAGKRIYSTLIPDTNEHYERITLKVPMPDAASTVLHIDLTKNRQLFSGSFVERIFHAAGEVLVTHTAENQSSSHCFYHGSVKGEEEYISAISTCHGISGVIFHRGEAYHIEPQHGDIAKLHHLYADSHRKSNNFTCGHQDSISITDPLLNGKKVHQRLKREVHWPYNRDEKTRLVELYIVNDKSQYDESGEDLQKLIHRNKEIVNIVSSLYRPINTYVALVGVEVWTERDEIEILTNADKTMNNFLTYRRQEISPKIRNDNAQLITSHTFGDGVVGKAPISTLCSWQYSGGVNMDHSALTGPTATTLAHELGHNFGLVHDMDEGCDCPHERCIMAASSSGNNPSLWSSCSMEQFDDMFHQGMDLCLRNLPDALYGRPMCGNGFLEEGEECDCGLYADCDNHCCNATTCRFTVNATCATGACCDLDACQLRKATYPCRPADPAASCDLPEACNGTSEFCPTDVYMRDGTECETTGGKESYCHTGSCATHESQCQRLWGVTGHQSHALCFSHFNPMGVASGHCGFDWITKEFTKCKQEDVMCGMLHCSHSNEKLMLWKESLAYTMPEAWVLVNGTRFECKGAILDVGLYEEDPGMVPAGTKCGEGKMCMDHKCQNISSLPLPQCPDCHGNGVCNSMGQCHCDVGYGPPYCDKAGSGGSTHSGPIGHYSGNKSMIVGLVVFFLVICPILVVLLILAHRNRNKLKEVWRSTHMGKYRTIYRSRPRTHDTENGSTRRPPAPTSVKRPTKAVPEVKVAQPRSTSIKKQQSFSRSDIGAIHLQESTNKKLSQIEDLPPENRSVTLQASRQNGPPQRPPAPKKAPSFRNNAPSSVVVNGPMEISQPSKVTGASTDTGGHVVPTRKAPPPPAAAISSAPASKPVPPRPLSPPGTAPLPTPSTRPSQLPCGTGYANMPSAPPSSSDPLSATYEDLNSPPTSPGNHVYANDTPPPPPRPAGARPTTGLNKPPLVSPTPSLTPTSPTTQPSTITGPKSIQPSTVAGLKSMFDNNPPTTNGGGHNVKSPVNRTESVKPTVARKPSTAATKVSHSNNSAVNRSNSVKPPPPPKPGAGRP